MTPSLPEGLCPPPCPCVRARHRPSGDFGVRNLEERSFVGFRGICMIGCSEPGEGWVLGGQHWGGWERGLRECHCCVLLVF